jgi:ubiquinone/menaquinone biosynthesis C-methylase UbiE
LAGFGDAAETPRALNRGMTMTTELVPPRPVTSRGEELAERIIGSLTAGSELLTIELGRRLGLYRALFDLGPATASELATHADIAPRYAREWLEQQAAGGILDVATSGDPESREYLLPAAHVPVLVDQTHPLSVVGAGGMLAGFGTALPEVERAYRSGEGVGFAEFGDPLRDGIAMVNRPMFTHSMRDWIRELPDIAARLDLGGVVLDAGCGVGWSTIALATAFPGAMIVGADTDTASIVEARGNARLAGVADRITFIEVNVSDPMSIRSPFDEDYTLVTVFEALHDMGEPIRALASFRGVLAPGGAVFVADELVADEFTAPAGEIERLQYAASVLHCLPATMAESTAIANGTVLRAPTVHGWAREAGFTGAERLDIENDFWQFYRIG